MQCRDAQRKELERLPRHERSRLRLISGTESNRKKFKGKEKTDKKDKQETVAVETKNYYFHIFGQ